MAKCFTIKKLKTKLRRTAVQKTDNKMKKTDMNQIKLVEKNKMPPTTSTKSLVEV